MREICKRNCFVVPLYMKSRLIVLEIDRTSKICVNFLLHFNKNILKASVLKEFKKGKQNSSRKIEKKN